MNKLIMILSVALLFSCNKEIDSEESNNTSQEYYMEIYFDAEYLTSNGVEVTLNGETITNLSRMVENGDNIQVTANNSCNYNISTESLQCPKISAYITLDADQVYSKYCHCEKLELSYTVE